MPAAGVGGKRKAAPSGASASEPAAEQPAKKKKKQTVAKPPQKCKELPVEYGYDAFCILPLSSLTLLFLNFSLLFGFLLLQGAGQPFHAGRSVPAALLGTQNGDDVRDPGYVRQRERTGSLRGPVEEGARSARADLGPARRRRGQPDASRN